AASDAGGGGPGAGRVGAAASGGTGVLPPDRAAPLLGIGAVPWLDDPALLGSSPGPLGVERVGRPRRSHKPNDVSTRRTTSGLGPRQARRQARGPRHAADVATLAIGSLDRDGTAEPRIGSGGGRRSRPCRTPLPARRPRGWWCGIKPSRTARCRTRA